MKRNKSLCESCSNRVVITFHGKTPNGFIIKSQTDDSDCFYNFNLWALGKNVATGPEYHKNINVSNVIVDECSFYNKSINRFNKPIVEDSNSDSDSDSDSKESGVGGVTFTNIPGALLP